MRKWLEMITLLSLGALLSLGCPTTDDDDVADDDGGDDDGGDDDGSDDDSAGDDDGGDDDSAGGAPDITVHPPQLNFGDQCIGVPQVRTITIANDGDAQLHVNGQICDLDPVTFQEFSGNIPPGGNPVVIDLTINCAVEGEQEGIFRISNNDPDEGQKVVPLLVMCLTC